MNVIRNRFPVGINFAPGTLRGPAVQRHSVWFMMLMDKKVLSLESVYFISF